MNQFGNYTYVPVHSFQRGAHANMFHNIKMGHCLHGAISLPNSKKRQPLRNDSQANSVDLATHRTELSVSSQGLQQQTVPAPGNTVHRPALSCRIASTILTHIATLGRKHHFQRHQQAFKQARWECACAMRAEVK